MKMLRLSAAAAACVALGTHQMLAQSFTNPPTVTSVSAAGTPSRQGVGAAVFNNVFYAYFVSTDGYLSVAADTAHNFSFSSVSRVSTPQGKITTSLNPAAFYLSGVMYVAYIANNAVYVMNSNDGVNFTTPANIPVPGNVKIDGSLTLAGGSSSLFLGLHDGTNQSLITCSLTLSYAQTCYKSPQGSTYGPGVIFANGLLWASAEANDSSHTLLWGNQYVNSNGQITGPMQFQATGGSADQTSAQPAMYDGAGANLVFAFRSNDSSGHFLYKTYNISSGAWSNSSDQGYGMPGAPDLIGSYSGGIADVNVFVQGGKIASSYASAAQ